MIENKKTEIFNPLDFGFERIRSDWKDNFAFIYEKKNDIYTIRLLHPHILYDEQPLFNEKWQIYIKELSDTKTEIVRVKNEFMKILFIKIPYFRRVPCETYKLLTEIKIPTNAFVKELFKNLGLSQNKW